MAHYFALLASVLTFAYTAIAVAGTPAYYVEWIQTSGTQFINTGVNGKAGIQAEVDFQFAAMGNGAVVLGSSAGSDATAFALSPASSTSLPNEPASPSSSNRRPRAEKARRPHVRSTPTPTGQWI